MCDILSLISTQGIFARYPDIRFSNHDLVHATLHRYGVRAPNFICTDHLELRSDTFP